MEKKIDLASLDIDIQPLIKAAEVSKKALLELRAEQAELKKTGQESSAQFIRNEVDLKRLSNSYNIQTKTIAAQVSEGGRLQNQQMAIDEATSRLNLTESEMRENNKQLLAIRKQVNTTTEEGQRQIAALNTKLDANNAAIKENVSAYEKQKIGIGQYKEQIIEAYRELDKEKQGLIELNKELEEQRDVTAEGSEEWKIFNQQINNNITQINIYTSEMAAARGETEDTTEATNFLSGSFGGFIGKAKEAGGAGPLMTKTFIGIRAGIAGATQAGIAFLATPLGAAIAAIAVVGALLVGTFKFMTASMNSTEEGSQKLAKVTATVTGFFNTFWKLLKPFGEYLGGAFIAYFELVSEAIATVIDGLQTAARFVGLDSVADGIGELKDEFAASAKAAADLATAEADLDKMQRNAKKTQLDYQKQAEKIRQQRDDESNSIGKRIQLNNELGIVLKKQLADELAIANQALIVANARIVSEGKTKEALDQQAEALAGIADVQERLTGQESEQLANLNSLRKEASDKAIEFETKRQAKIQESLDKYAEKLSVELDIFEATADAKEKTMLSELNTAARVRDRRLELAKAEFEATKKTSIDILKLQKSQNEAKRNYLEESANITQRYAQAEIDLYVQQNQTILKNGQLLTEGIISEEAKRLATIRDMQLEQLAREKKTDAEKIALKQKNNEDLTEADLQYLTQKSALEQQYNEQINTNKDALTAKSKAQEVSQLEADKEIKLLNAATEYEEQLINEQARFDAEMLRLHERLNSKEITQQQYDSLRTAREKENADNVRAINENVFLSKLALAEQTYNGISAILGKESTAGKAVAIAQATIDTYKSAVSAYSSLAGIPVVGPALGAVAAAAAVGLGLANVKKIASTKAPKAERGALFNIGGNRHSNGGTMFEGADGTRFEAEKGELIGVMNRNAAHHFMAFNNAFPAGGSSVPVSNYLEGGGVVSRGMQQPLNLDDLAMKIGAATAAANATLPAPVVSVQDIAAVSNKMINVQENSNF